MALARLSLGRQDVRKINASENEFSLTRAAPRTSRRVKTQIQFGEAGATMATLTRLITVAMLVRLGWAADLPAAAVNFAEMRELHRWMAAKFDGDRQAAPPQWGLAVLTNFDELCLNTRMGQPLAIGKTEYARGIFCHATSKVAVRLPAPGKTFSAFVGVDSNSQTRGGRGSIVFAVTVAEKEAFRSNVMREGTPAERVSLDLGGATEFLLEVGDAGDGTPRPRRLPMPYLERPATRAW